MNNAGTDANVFISLFGDKNKIVKHQLKKPDSGKDPFEKGHKDEFSFEDEDIGKVCLLYSIDISSHWCYLPDSWKQLLSNMMEKV